MRLLSEIIQHVLLAQGKPGCDPKNIGSVLCNPLGYLNVSTVPELIAKILNDLGGLIGLLAIAMIVFAGFRLVTANGEKAAIESGKRILTYSIYGFVISIMAYTAVAAIVNFLGVGALEQPGPTPITPLGQFANLKEFLVFLLRRVLEIVGLVSLLMIILNGYKYMTARGNQSQVDSAKLGLTWAIGGLILSLLAYTLISAINRLIS